MYATPHHASGPAELPQLHLTIQKAKPTLWERMGGSALTFAVGFSGIVLIGLGCWYFILPAREEVPRDIVPHGGGGSNGADAAQQAKRRQQMTRRHDARRVQADGKASPFILPVQGEGVGEISPLESLVSGGPAGGAGDGGPGGIFGRGGHPGGGMPDGTASGRMAKLIPMDLGGRCSKADRLARIQEMGGTPQCEEAVEKALRWLRSKQRPDGSWSCSGRTVAMTGLTLLAYFGRCESPGSQEYGASCLGGITFLVDKGMKNGGRMADGYSGHSWCYEHAIATYALGEAVVFCKAVGQEVPGLDEVVGQAGQHILDHQHPNGGWAYGYETGDGAHTDVSITGWQIQALKACSHTGIRFKGMNGAVSKALRFIERRQGADGGIGYASADDRKSSGYHHLTGVGMLCHQIWGRGSASVVRKAAGYVMDQTRFDFNRAESDLYGHYYESQAMMRMGGEYWKKYNGIFRDQLLANQNPDGSWKAPNGGGTGGIRAVAPEFVNNEVYRTCLCTLMLEVYYRYLSTGGGAD